MSENIKVLVGSLIRKLLFGAGAVWIAKLVEMGILTEGDTERFVQILTAAAMIGVAALWSFIRRQLQHKVVHEDSQ